MPNPITWESIVQLSVGLIAVGGVIMGIGSAFFRTKKSCEDEQDKCQSNVEAKIDRVIEKVVDIEKTQNNFQANLHITMTEISGHMGKVNQFIEDRKHV